MKKLRDLLKDADELYRSLAARDAEENGVVWLAPAAFSDGQGFAMAEDFAEALEFTNDVGAIAEEEGHHPAILTEWGRVTVTWWTHKIRGLHRNDFIMAAKTDQIYEDV